MQRFHQLLFAFSLLALSWFAMMAVHEFGHVCGAVLTGGTIEQFVLHPLSISHTDVYPNPHPALVVWLGPVMGCVLPLAVFASLPRQQTVARNVARFFAEFCLIANGAYIAVGSFNQVGDCGEMVRTGTPPWVLPLFGSVALSLGLWQWHVLGSPIQFIRNPSLVTRRMAYLVFGIWVVVVAMGFTLSPR
jgi:hypothetical protein